MAVKPLTTEEIAELRRVTQSIGPATALSWNNGKLQASFAGPPPSVDTVAVTLVALPRLLDEVERARAGLSELATLSVGNNSGEEMRRLYALSAWVRDRAAAILSGGPATSTESPFVARVRALLKRIEWRGTATYGPDAHPDFGTDGCPECGGAREPGSLVIEGHRPDCELAALLGPQ